MKRALWSFGTALLLSTALAGPLAAQAIDQAAPAAARETPAAPACPALEPFELQLPFAAAFPVCGTLKNTPNRTALGSSCAQAQSNLQATLLNETTCGECGFCSQTFLIGQCVAVSGGFQVSGYLRYKCVLCPL
jgi:hypothetical protein